jgi:hypothetical protein
VIADVSAESVYEAAALGLSRLRRDEWADQIAPGTPIEITVREPATTDTVSLAQILTGDVLTDLERLRSITQRDRELNSWAFRSFRDVADGDYIAARMAYRSQLPVQFLWASQQAIEKYLKCALFIRRKPAKNVRHDLAPALKLLEDAGVPVKLTERSQKFITRIDQMSQYRYMEASLWVDWHWIVSLDQVVWELRRFSTLDPVATQAKLVEGKWAPRVRIVGGHLEGS